jgi:hypothetical protein
MLAATPNCAVGVTTAECLRRHVLLPVDVGYFQNFCGRTWLGEAAGHFEGGRGPELVNMGVELRRLLAGSAWTSFGHRVPQTDVFALSRAVLAMGLQGELGPKFAAVARNTDVSFRNRYRARVLSLSFESELDEAALLREFRAVVSPCVPGTNPEACAPQPNDAQLDLTCIQHTLGLANLACAHG